jgi:hypothetical protein
MDVGKGREQDAEALPYRLFAFALTVAKYRGSIVGFYLLGESTLDVSPADGITTRDGV